MNPSRRRAIGLGAAMTAAAGFAMWARPLPLDPGRFPQLELDRAVPARFADWAVDPATVAFVRPAGQQGRRYAIYDQVLERVFVGSAGDRVMLSIALGSEQSSSLQLHRPEICYRAGGFTVRNLHGARLGLVSRDIPVTRLEAEMEGRPEPITYWTVLGGETVADAGAFRFRRLWLAAQRRVAEGVLVRISSIDSDPQRAYALHHRFANDLARALPDVARDRLLGWPPVA